MKLRINHTILSNFTCNFSRNSEKDIVAAVTIRYKKLRELYHILDNAASDLEHKSYEKYIKKSSLATAFNNHAVIIDDYTLKAIDFNAIKIKKRYNLALATNYFNVQTALIKTTFYLMFKAIHDEKLTDHFRLINKVTNNKITTIKNLLVASYNNYMFIYDNHEPKMQQYTMLCVNYDYLDNYLPKWLDVTKAQFIEHILSQKNKVINIIHTIRAIKPQVTSEVLIAFIKSYPDYIERRLNNIQTETIIEQFNSTAATECYNLISSLLAISSYNILYSIDYYIDYYIDDYAITDDETEVLIALRHKIKAFNK